MALAAALNAQPVLNVTVATNYPITTISSVRYLRLSWSVTNSGNQAFVGPNRCTQPGEFTTLFGQPAVAHVWGFTMTHVVTEVNYDAVGAAPVSWNIGSCETGIAANAQVVAPGYLTMFDLTGIPSGIYFCQFAFDPLGAWNGFAQAQPFYVRLFGDVCEPIRWPSDP